MSASFRSSTEEFWVHRYHSLKNKGYLLRPRYHPDWKPPWKYDGNPFVHEDAHPGLWVRVMDAVKLDEKKKVVLKFIEDDLELDIHRELLSVPDERNHTVPLIDVFRLPAGAAENVIVEEVYIVIPFLRRALDPPYFERLGEVLSLIDQFLRGLEFMHEQNISHRDACYGNLMVDASGFIPDNHFSATEKHDGVHNIRPLPRSVVPDIKYFFIDFGLSVRCLPRRIPTARNRVGQDKTVPEFQGEVKVYNPMKVDVYQLGNTIVRRLLEVYDGLEFLRPLTDCMTVADPHDRPTASKARKCLESLTTQCDRRLFLCLKTDGRLTHLMIMLKNWMLTRRRSG
ncbi:hypothetical protein C8R46DRAFT_1106448 [Mycena filopes]|nr:hypothetical protein C8R46DRAFT_1106448 [Mycena filopes]